MPPPPPIQREDYNLTKDYKNGGSRLEDSPRRDATRADERSPAALMRSLGFEPTRYMTPLQFLVAVFNDDMDAIYKNEKKKAAVAAKGGIGMSYRVECAKTAARYIHMEMPKVSIQDDSGNFGESLAAAARAGNERLRTRTMIIETVERISPDIPLPPANYPAMYEKGANRVINEDGSIEGEPLNPEGDKDYNPDAE